MFHAKLRQKTRDFGKRWNFVTSLTSLVELWPPNFAQVWPRYSFEAMQSLSRSFYGSVGESVVNSAIFSSLTFLAEIC